MFPVLVGLLQKTLLQCFLQRTTFLLARIAGQLFEMDADDYIDRSFVGKKAGDPKNIRGRVEEVIATQGQYLWLVLSKLTHVSCFHCFVFFPFPSTLKLHMYVGRESEQILVVKFDMATSNHQHNQACKVLQAGECWAHLMPVGDTGRGISGRFSQVFLRFSEHSLQCFQLTHWWVFSLVLPYFLWLDVVSKATRWWDVFRKRCCPTSVHLISQNVDSVSRAVALSCLHPFRGSSSVFCIVQEPSSYLACLS